MSLLQVTTRRGDDFQVNREQWHGMTWAHVVHGLNTAEEFSIPVTTVHFAHPHGPTRHHSYRRRPHQFSEARAAAEIEPRRDDNAKQHASYREDDIKFMATLFV